MDAKFEYLPYGGWLEIYKSCNGKWIVKRGDVGSVVPTQVRKTDNLQEAYKHAHHCARLEARYNLICTYPKLFKREDLEARTFQTANFVHRSSGTPIEVPAIL